MIFRTKMLATLVLVLFAHSATVGFAQTGDFPMRETPRPQTTDGVPHIQIGIEATPAFSNAILQHVSLLSGVSLGATRLSLAGAVGFHIDQNITIPRPEVIVGGREFAHLHPDGSLHASLHPETARKAVEAGWAIHHPWAGQRKGWEGFVMIYTPTTTEELEVVLSLIDLSYRFVIGAGLNS